MFCGTLPYSWTLQQSMCSAFKPRGSRPFQLMTMLYAQRSSHSQQAELWRGNLWVSPP